MLKIGQKQSIRIRKYISYTSLNIFFFNKLTNWLLNYQYSNKLFASKVANKKSEYCIFPNKTVSSPCDQEHNIMTSWKTIIIIIIITKFEMTKTGQATVTSFLHNNCSDEMQ